MSDRREEFRVGVVALATAVIVVLLVALNTGTTFNFGGGSPYEITIRVNRAPGVGPNTPVRKDGVLIGRVVDTEFIHGGGVLVRAKIQPDAPIYGSDACRIRPSSLFGDAVINFVYTGEAADPQPIEPGVTIRGQALPDPIEALTSLQVDVGPALQSIGEAADGISLLTGKLNNALGEDFGGDRVNSLLSEATSAMDQFSTTMHQMQQTMNAIDSLFTNPDIKQGLKQATADVPLLLAEARTTVQRAGETLEAFDGVISSAKANFENLEGLTKPLGERGDEISRLIIAAIESLNNSLTEFEQFTSALNSADGTISRLVNDSSIADNLDTTIANANTVIVRVNELLKDFRPIVYDARVFFDKIAREPGRLVGGALQKGPGLK